MSNKGRSQESGSVEGLSLIVAIIAMLFAGWSAFEAHSARIEARKAIDDADRSANAAEKSNNLAARSQSSYLVPSIQKSTDSAVISVKNVSANVALNVHAGYFLYAGPLKSVDDVSAKLNTLQLKQLVMALAGSDKVDIIDTPIVTTDTVESSITIPVTKVDQVLFLGTPIGIPHVVMETQKTEVKVPSKALVIGLVSSEDTANVRHTATFCFPVASGSNDEECSKLNSLQLANSSDIPRSSK
jgi:hypothetical protein